MAAATRATDMAFLHYRDAAFLIQAQEAGGRADPTLPEHGAALPPLPRIRFRAGGTRCWAARRPSFPPQTSTIASRILPKAVGAAHSIGMAQRLKLADAALPHDAVILCSFGETPRPMTRPRRARWTRPAGGLSAHPRCR